VTGSYTNGSTPLAAWETGLEPEDLHLNVCASNDCQDPNITKSNMEQYAPATKSTLYLVIGCLASLELLGIFFHARFSAEVGGSSEKEKNTGTPYVCHHG